MQTFLAIMTSFFIPFNIVLFPLLTLVLMRIWRLAFRLWDFLEFGQSYCKASFGSAETSKNVIVKNVQIDPSVHEFFIRDKSMLRSTLD